jgi:hypothetical protein
MVFSILKVCTNRAPFALAAALLVGGCTHAQREQHGRYEANPIDERMKDPLPDAAAQARNFEPSTLYYPNGQVVAFPVWATTYETRPRYLGDDVAYGMAAPLIYLADIGIMPLRMVTQPPWSLVLYSGAQYGPSMTVAPPLPGNLPEGDKSEVPGNPSAVPVQ